MKETIITITILAVMLATAMAIAYLLPLWAVLGTIIFILLLLGVMIGAVPGGDQRKELNELHRRIAVQERSIRNLADAIPADEARPDGGNSHKQKKNKK
jgi:hypothetical protein